MGKTHREVKPGSVYRHGGTHEEKPRYQIEEHRPDSGDKWSRANKRSADRSERQDTKQILRRTADDLG